MHYLNEYNNEGMCDSLAEWLAQITLKIPSWNEAKQKNKQGPDKDKVESTHQIAWSFHV